MAQLYFAYGSNVMSARIKATDRAPHAIALGSARLKHYRLTFDKLGRDGSGKCDIMHTGQPDDVVYGAVYQIDDADRMNLDRVEYLGTDYEVIDIVVEMIDGRSIQVFAYAALIKQQGLLPYPWYKNFVVGGAREYEFPASYIAALERVPTINDPDPDRAARNQEIAEDSISSAL